MGKTTFSEKLSHILFLNIKKEVIRNTFKVDIEQDIYLPIKSQNIIDETKKGSSMDSIPVNYFIEGMFYVLGADEKFKFNDAYAKILNSIKDSSKYIKGIVAKEVNDNNLVDAYIFLRGLLRMESSEEIFDKALIVIDELRKNDGKYEDEELYIIDKAKKVPKYSNPYLLEAILYNDKDDYDRAYSSLNNYLSLGGENNQQISDFMKEVKNNKDFNKGKNEVHELPEEALKLLIPLLNENENNTTLLYYVAIAYRELENYEKAIYYLSVALEKDNSLVEVVNELGLNYACLEDYKDAIMYFKKAFEATRSIEICTNIIMCYLKLGDYKNANLHLELGKKLKGDDEVLKDIEKYMTTLKNN